MTNIFSQYVEHGGCNTAKLHTVFDASRDAPNQMRELARTLPQIGEVMDSLREHLPLTPSASVGPHCDGNFYRLPNHYRSVSFLLPPTETEACPGVIVFKGTEPLLSDFEGYYDWMLSARFRSSPLPLGLHFALDLKIPPAAMWISESVVEQESATGVQDRFLKEFGYFGRLPIPLFVLKYTDAQVSRYAEIVRARVPEAIFRKFSSKVRDGLGVEIYFYPTVPLRVADLSSGRLKDEFGISLSTENVTATTGKWTKLLADLLLLRYMPYVPWNRGMGGCVDSGNVCLDGGFNDLLTLTSFDGIPSKAIFRHSLGLSIRMLADTIAAYCGAASVGYGLSSQDSEASAFSQRFVFDQVCEHLRAMKSGGHSVDNLLMEVFERPSAADIVNVLREEHVHGLQRSDYVSDM